MVVADDSGITERDRERFASLEAYLDDPLRAAHFVGYDAAEIAAERLGAMLMDEFGRDRISAGRFVAIPRGGYIVLGMLSYMLDLQPHQLRPGPSDEVFVVDDVAVTGGRLLSFLDHLGSGRVVVAHLASAPELRMAALADPRVTGCVAAIDLRSPRDDSAMDADDEWQNRLTERMWSGEQTPIAFAWAEPDRMLWRPDLGAIEPGWRYISPEKCLKNRMLLGPPSHDRTKRTLRFPDNLAFGQFDDHVLILLIDGSAAHRLEGTAGAIWGALGTLGDAALATRALADRYDVGAEQLERDVRGLAAQLVAAGLLVEVIP